ncbi:MAG: hypothetical protein KDA77_00010 [Planctomycetaceae bacterium]|nr:hypothetical protein [Planctomycetaceae bacterium]
MINFECPHCQNAIRVSEAAAGREGTCNNCGNKIRVPNHIVTIEPRAGESSDKAINVYFKWLKISSITLGLIASTVFVVWTIVSGINSNERLNAGRSNTTPPGFPIEAAEVNKIEVSKIVPDEDYNPLKDPHPFPSKFRFDDEEWHLVGYCRNGISVIGFIPLMYTSGNPEKRLALLPFSTVPEDKQKPTDIVFYASIQSKADGRWINDGLNEIQFRDGIKTVQFHHMGKLDGLCRNYYSSGQISSATVYKNDELHGRSRGWYASGKPKWDSMYEYGQEVSGKAFKEDGTEY